MCVRLIFNVWASFALTISLYGQSNGIPVAQARYPVLKASSPALAGFSASRLKRLDESLLTWTKDARLNGCVALVARKGHIIYHKAFGYNDLEQKQPLRTDYIFRIASQTKAITSAAVLMLYEEGKFLLDDPVSRYIPAFAKPVVLDQFNAADTTFTTKPAKGEVTIRQLLTHTSGVSYPQIGSPAATAIYAKAGLIAGLGAEPGRSLEKDVNTIAKLPLMHQPGDQWTYGFNTDILGRLIEVVSGMSLEQFLRMRLFDPLGMKDTYFYLPADKQSRLAQIFQEKEGKLVLPERTISSNGESGIDYPLVSNTYYSGGGGLSSTVWDYAVFLQMILNGGEYNGRRYLSRHTVRMMTMNQIGQLGLGPNKFGLGFMITTEQGSALLPTPEGVFQWSGAFSTFYWVDPVEQLIGVYYQQLFGSTMTDNSSKFKVLVYQALE